MSTVVNPVGPESSSVYWRRRVIALVIVLVAILLVLRACVFDSDPTTAPSTTVPTSTAPETEPAPSTPAESPTTAPATTTSAATNGAIGPCADSAIAVSTVVADEQYPVGGPVPIRFAVRTTGDQPCTRDVGAAANTVQIRSEGRRIWSSDDCTPGGNPDVRTLEPGEAFTVTVRWQGDISSPACEAVRPKAPSGTYEVIGRNGAVVGAADTFTLG